jgi:hypothetical protein
MEYAKKMDLNLIPYENFKDMTSTKEVLSKIKEGMDVGIFIGPEGGFEESEVNLARESGVKEISLGKRILRTETAGIATLAILMFMTKDRRKNGKRIWIMLQRRMCMMMAADIAVCIMKEAYGNPSSLHGKGLVLLKTILKKPEKIISSKLKVKENEIYFTSGGTEGNNLLGPGKRRGNKRKGNIFITHRWKHPSVYNAFKTWRKRGFEVTYLRLMNME